MGPFIIVCAYCCLNNSFMREIPMKPTINPPFYYGWLIVAIAALSHFFSGPGQTFSNAIFIDYYIEEFGWSRSTVSGIYSAVTLLAGFMQLPLLGIFAALMANPPVKGVQG